LFCRILWAFDILPELKEDGTPNLPDPNALEPGLVCKPKPFGYNIVSRDGARAEVVKREAGRADEELKGYD